MYNKIKQTITNCFSIPDNFYRKNNISLIVATMGGLGYVKKAPGTWGSLVTLIIMLPIAYLSHTVFTIIATSSIVVGFYVCEKHYSEENQDPSYIIIDEFAGMSLSIILISNYIILLGLIAFVLFRFLDIKKPWIIGMSEKFFPRATAIMMDDIVAGMITMITVTIISSFIY